MASPSQEVIDELSQGFGAMDLGKGGKYAYAHKIISNAITRSSEVHKKDKEEMITILTEEVFVANKEYGVKTSSFQDTARTALRYKTLNATSRYNKTLDGLLGAIQAELIEKEKEDNRFMIAGPMFMISETKRSNNIDLNRFHKRVQELLDWRDVPNKREMFISPYFPIVQSSGMGKTKLMDDYRSYSADGNNATVRDGVILISCMGEDWMDEQTKRKFDSILQLNKPDKNNLNLERDNFLDQLRRIISECCQSSSRVVLLFDEAQNLLEEDGFHLKCLRRFLHRKVFGLKNKMNEPITNIVAVLAGTSQSLSQLYPETQLTTSFSREAEIEYLSSGSEIFPPFVDLWTVGSLKGRIEYGNDATEYDISIQYGRPLFARMIAPGEHTDSKSTTRMTEHLLDSQHHSILKRMMLGNLSTDWMEDLKACMSLLATRVQLGNIHSSVVSDLVSKGYANLVFFRGSQRNSSLAVSRFCYMTDPVCARLAMCMMLEGFSVGEYCGQDPKFWIRQLSHLMSGGLYSPSRGDLVKVAVALNMLLCGDQLRNKENTNLTSFSVSLGKLISMMQEDNFDEGAEDFPAFPAVSFIQVTRNELRVQYNKEYLTDQVRLKRLYESGQMMYVHEGCNEIDMLGSVKFSADVGENNQFLPLLISVKCRASFAAGEQKLSVKGMVEMLGTDNSGNSGICILVLLDLDESVGIHEPNGEEIAKAEAQVKTAKKNLEIAFANAKAAPEEIKAASDEAKAASEEAFVSNETDESKEKFKSLNKALDQAQKRLVNAILFEGVNKALLADLDKANIMPVARIVRIPSGDQFGITDLIRSATRVGNELAEVYSSHDHLDVQGPDRYRGSVLRAKKLPANGSDSENVSPSGDVEDVLDEFYGKAAVVL